jgi:hypothetical protein
MLARKAALASGEIGSAEALATRSAAGASVVAAFPKERQVRIIDAAYDRLRYKEGIHEKPSAAFARTERELLILRGRTGVPPQDPVVVPGVDAPERGHRTFRIGIGGGLSKRGGTPAGFEELAFRLALHDHLDAPRGYVGDAVLEMGSFKLRFDNDRRAVALDRADLTDLGQVVLTPGLVNPHTHLELGCYAGRLKPGPFWPWLKQLVELRRAPGQQERERQAAGQGAWASLRAGVTCVGDISRLNVAWHALKEVPIRKVCFVELLTLADGPPRNPQELAAAR